MLMRKDTLKSGQMIKATREHKNGLNERRGSVSGINNKQLKISNETEAREEVKSEPIPPGWIEFYI